MTSYSREQFETMQQEALRRVREMQRRANAYVDNNQEEEKKPHHNEKANHKALQENKQQNQQQNHNSSNGTSQNNSQHSHANNHQNNQSNNSNVKNSNTSKEANNSSHTQSNKNSHASNNTSNHNRNNSSNPFAQLFGSNLGGFNRAKEYNDKKVNEDNIVGEITGSISKAFKDFNLDEDKMLILLLIYILYKNGADVKLILALAYLII